MKNMCALQLAYIPSRTGGGRSAWWWPSRRWPRIEVEATFATLHSTNIVFGVGFLRPRWRHWFLILFIWCWIFRVAVATIVAVAICLFTCWDWTTEILWTFACHWQYLKKSSEMVHDCLQLKLGISCSFTLIRRSTFFLNKYLYVLYCSTWYCRKHLTA